MCIHVLQYRHLCRVQSHLRGKRERSCVHSCLRFLCCWERRPSWVWTLTHCWRTGGFYSLRRHREEWQKTVTYSTKQHIITSCTARPKCDMNWELKSWDFFFYLSSRWGVLCTEHPESSSPGSILSASASWAGWITSGWCGSKTQWSIWNPFPHSPRSFLKNLEVMQQKWKSCIILKTFFTAQSNVWTAQGNSRAHSFCQELKMMLIAIRYLAISSLSSQTMGTHWPKSAFFPFSSGKKRRSTAHTRMCSGTPGDLAPTSSKPAGTSMGSVAMETAGGPCRPDRTLRRKDFSQSKKETDVIFEL